LNPSVVEPRPPEIQKKPFALFVLAAYSLSFSASIIKRTALPQSPGILS
jgi:hypothetical protein